MGLLHAWCQITLQKKRPLKVLGLPVHILTLTLLIIANTYWLCIVLMSKYEELDVCIDGGFSQIHAVTSL